MATYTYETIGRGRKQQFVLLQGMNDAPFTHHPETGVPIKRVITGGCGFTCKNIGKMRPSDFKDSRFMTKKLKEKYS